VRLRRSLAWRFAELGPRMVVGLHGACLGAGIELPAFAHRLVAADDAVIGLPEGSLGLIPGAGGTVSIRHRIGSGRTLDLIVSGRHIDAATAHSWGLVDEVVPRSELETRLQQLVA
jgi:enoyl-CoA hydratase/carnithine racemase